MKAVMYHYVRPDPQGLPHFKHLNLDDFRRQIDFLQSKFRFASQEEFLASIAGKPITPGSVVLTFDDGLSDHWRYVFPELNARGLWGIFYIAAGPYLNRKLLDVHRVHMLLGRFGGEAMNVALNRCIRPEMLVQEHVEEFQRSTYTRQINSEKISLFKRTLNYYVAYEWREKILDTLMTDSFGRIEPNVDDYYMSSDEIKGLHDAGMIVGSHSLSHLVLSTLSIERQKFEIEESFNFLDACVGGLSTRTFCYPYGGFRTFTTDTEALLVKAGCKFSFNVESRDICDDDLSRRPHALPRYDCNEFPHGAVRNGACQ